MGWQHVVALGSIALASAGCGARDGLDLLDAGSRRPAAPGAVLDARAADARLDDAAVEGIACVAAMEICNGLDDDCDSRVDDGVEVRRCPNGGESICIAGVYSECPRRCEVCVPGSARVCFVSICTVWGRQVCQADGFGWGGCAEEQPPGDCDGGAFGALDEPSTGECCRSLGLCCVDRWDADGDGDTDEGLGACDATSCD